MIRRRVITVIRRWVTMVYRRQVMQVVRMTVVEVVAVMTIPSWRSKVRLMVLVACDRLVVFGCSVYRRLFVVSVASACHVARLSA